MRQSRNPLDTTPLPTNGALRIYVGGLTDQLADIKENDLRDVIHIRIEFFYQTFHAN